jgi:hypothetical protein
MAGKGVVRKERRTYTLSGEAISILEAEKMERHAKSASAALEELLKDRRRQKEMADVAASISGYYDSLSEDEIREDQLWGQFSESQFPLE